VRRNENREPAAARIGETPEPTEGEEVVAVVRPPSYASELGAVV
jgi:hypothetical protein